MSTASQDERFAPPQSHVEDIEPTGAIPLVSRWSRLGAAIIDVIVYVVLMWLASVVTPWKPFAAPEEGFWLSFQFGSALGGFVILLLAQGYLLATRGQTIGKLVLGLRIVRTDGASASFGRLVGLRYGVGSLFAIVPVLGQIYGWLDAMFIFHSSRRCLHDRIADTIVVKA
ncbi:MAG: RDD family protein [Rhodoferax sp.]|nr:RDD family protein [Rhodoferax sp.]